MHALLLSEGNDLPFGAPNISRTTNRPQGHKKLQGYIDADVSKWTHPRKTNISYTQIYFKHFMTPSNTCLTFYYNVIMFHKKTEVLSWLLK